MFKRAKYLVLAFVVGATLLAPVFVQPLNAQVLYGSVVGTVTDQTGALVPKAAVTITNVNTGRPGKARPTTPATTQSQTYSMAGTT